MAAIWVGIDSGKRAHHAVVLDGAGTLLLSIRVENDEATLLGLVQTVSDLAAGDQVCWATDLNAGGAALLIALLGAHAQPLLYIPGRVVHHAAPTYRGDGKTPRTRGSSPTRPGCAPTCNRCAALIRSPSTCDC